MARLHLFEWEDQPWLPAALRDFITDHLRYTFSAPRAAPIRRTIADIVAPVVVRSRADSIVDVCSGGGGPLPAVLPLIEQIASRPLRATLTDLFPNQRAFEEVERATAGKVRGEMRPVSAFDVPEGLGTLQTLFTAFHHFDETSARKVLADAAAKGRSIAIIEPFRRKDAALVAVGGFIRGLVETPRVGRLTLARALLTYPIPISALVLAWDGFVSCLRAYSPDEMLRLAHDAAPSGYRWQAGFKAIEGSPLGLEIAYLIGEPVRTA